MDSSSQEAAVYNYLDEEDRLRNILSRISGVGEVQVMITYAGGSELVPAYNSDSSVQSSEETSVSGTTRTLSLIHILEGLGIGDATPEGKMIGKIVEVLEDMAQAMDEMDEMVAELDERVDELDIDLSEVEDELYGEDECDCGCEDEDCLLYTSRCG